MGARRVTPGRVAPRSRSAPVPIGGSCTIGPMTVPSRTEAASLLLSFDPPVWHVRHSRAVAEIAAWLAGRAAGRGESVDVALAESAALLHDVDKVLPHARQPDGSEPDGSGMARLRHGDGSAAWLRAQGHGELAEAAAWHPVDRLVDEGWEALVEGRLARETLIVAYADKRAGQRRETLEQRFAGWERRYPDGWPTATSRLALRRARILEERVCALAGASPEDVGRLRWTGRAIGRASKAASKAVSPPARRPGPQGGIETRVRARAEIRAHARAEASRDPVTP